MSDHAALSGFRWGARTHVMAIVNVTPDSFAGMGPGEDTAAAVAWAERAVAEGADIIDIGGESTRPGARLVDEQTELRRVLPVVEALAGRLSVPLSIDTAKPGVARAALAAGATIVNDVHGLRGDPAMARVCAESGAAVVAMANMREQPQYGDDIIAAVLGQLRRSLQLAEAAGIPRGRVILDPGFGFGVGPRDNLAMTRRLRELQVLGCPLLLGPSRKSTIGAVLDLPVEERVEGTAALVALAVAGGVDIVRVHDVRAMVRVVRMADAVVRGWPPPEASGRATGTAQAATVGAARNSV